MSEQSTALQWSVTTGGAYVCGPYLIAERVDDRGWNASKSNETLVLADTLERCKKACETDAATPHPEALRLADALDVGEISYTGMCKAAAELRRLSAENETLKRTLAAPWPHEHEVLVLPPLRRLHAQRDALLEALRKHVYLHDKDCVCEDCAAIKQAEENT